MVTMKIFGVTETLTLLERMEKDSQKALSTAVRAESYRLTQQLKADLRKGRAGNSALTPLSPVTRKIKRMRGKAQRPPLAPAAVAIRYNAARDGSRVEIGFVDTYREKLSRSWHSLANLLQDGGSVPVSSAGRGMIRLVAGKRGGVTRAMRKETTVVELPARPVITPFWSSQRGSVFGNIQANFERKLRGERI